MDDASKRRKEDIGLGKIFAVRNDRLGGRLGAMLNAKRIADDYGLEFGFAWASHEAVSPELQHPETLFSGEFLKRHRETELGFGDLQSSALAVEELPSHINRDQFIEKFSHQRLRCNDSYKAVALPWEDPEAVCDRVAQTIHSIDFVPMVKKVMEDICTRLGDVNLVAYHLRRGDIINPDARPSNVLWPTKYIPRVFYEVHIDRILREDENTRIVVFSDAPHEVAAFCAISDRVIAASDILDDPDLEILQRDFLELYTMSLCKRIIAPGASAFSSVAAILGNGKIIPIIHDLNDDERDQALNKLSHQLENEPEAFAGDADIGQNFPELIAWHRQKGTSDTARRILQKHHERGFRQSYIHDLLAEEHFIAGDHADTIQIADSLRNRPILTDLANPAVYAWAGLAAFADGHLRAAARFAHIANWLQPILPITRVLMASLVNANAFGRDNHYPVSQDFIVYKYPNNDRFGAIARRLPPIKTDQTDQAAIPSIPFEVEIRDWHILQSTRLPSPFWNVPKQKKMIGFFRSVYRRVINKPHAISLLGQMCCQAEDMQNGRKLITKAFETAPDDPIVAIRHARMLIDQGKHDEGLAGYAEAARLADNQICYAAEYGLNLLRCGHKKEAAEIFLDIAERDHDMIEIDILTADVLRRKGDTRDIALRVAARVDDKVPGGQRTSQVHCKVLEQLGRENEARELEKRFAEWNRSPGNFSSRVNKIV